MFWCFKKLNRQDQSQQSRLGIGAIGIQGGRDVKVGQLTVTTGVTVSDVREICMLTFNDNFPRLRAEAMALAKANVQDFVPLIEQAMAKAVNRIEVSRLAKPDVQAALNDAVQATARKGQTIDLELLADLVVNRLVSGTSELFNIVADEAIRVLPRLRSAQLSFLALSVALSIKRVPPEGSPEELEQGAQLILPYVKAGFDLPQSDHLHLVSLGVAVKQIFTFESKWATLTSKFPFLYDVPNPEYLIRTGAPTYARLLDQYKANAERLELTPVGLLLGSMLYARAVSCDALQVFEVVSNANPLH